MPDESNASINHEKMGLLFSHMLGSPVLKTMAQKKIMPIVWNITLTPNRITNLRCPSPSLFDVQSAGGSKSGPHALLHLFSASVPFARDITTHVLVWARQGRRPQSQNQRSGKATISQERNSEIVVGFANLLGIGIMKYVFSPGLVRLHRSLSCRAEPRYPTAIHN